MAASGDEARRNAIKAYQSALLQIRKQEADIARLNGELREQGRLFRKSEDDIKALQVRGARAPPCHAQAPPAPLRLHLRPAPSSSPTPPLTSPLPTPTPPQNPRAPLQPPPRARRALGK